jgi:PQQ-dependent dehydrogenase (methanol/ethanol family)
VAAGAALGAFLAQNMHGFEVEQRRTLQESEWPTYNNGYEGRRFSLLRDITARNVGSLREVCRLQLAEGGSFHTGPVVVDRAMYLTTALDTFSIDPTDCSVRWRSTYELEQSSVWPANRGVAVMNGRVFRGTVDGRLLALDAGTGNLIWKDVVGDPTLNEFVSGAPLAWNGLVITGTSGSDLGIKGRILAYDARTGREAWRFATIPTGDEVGADTWVRRQSAEIGGGGTWSSFALDAGSGEIFVPVGNPAPTNAPESRPGANLFTNSVVVLDARTGALKWWYQLDPNDSHDYDLGAAPMLYTTSDGRQVVAAAGKDGYLHVVDRLTHRLLFKTAVTTIENEGVRPSEKERRFCPGGLGGNQWNGPALDPTSRTLFVGAVDWCSMVRSTGETRFIKGEGRFLHGATTSMVMNPPPSGWLTALDADSGKVKWKYHAAAPIVAGVTPTAGGIVLTGDMAGNFLALDSRIGTLLYKKQTGGAVAGGVVTYAVEGRQYIAFTSGNVSRSTFGAVGVPTLVILSLAEQR